MPVIQYKCPNCGSGMVYDSETGKLSCPACGRQDDIDTMPDPQVKQVFTEEDQAREYHCGNCGAVVMTDALTSATNCSFCGSAVVLSDRLAGELAPVQIIPFSVSKEEAIQAFRKWCGKGLVTPSRFMQADRIKEITGLYVPYWLYDLHNDVEVHGRATKVRSYRQGDYQITETDHYEIYRRINLDYIKVPIDAAEKLDDKLMDKLEPFPYQRLETFKTPYLAGYIAEKYSYDDEQLLPRAERKIRGFIEDFIDSTTSGYSSVSYTNVDIDTTVKRADYVLLPVWVLLYDFDNSKYTFAMNGQTGKVVGKPPISKVKVAAWFTGISGGLFAVMQAVSWWVLGGGM